MGTICEEKQCIYRNNKSYNHCGTCAGLYHKPFKGNKELVAEVPCSAGVSKPDGKLKPVEITNFSENKAAIYFDAIFEDENGKRWEAQFNSKFKFDLVAC